MLEKTTRVNLLYDFYGPLLTKKQQNFIELYFQHNLSLGEISEEYKISRQAVYDLIRRSVSSLEKFENKLHLCSRHMIQQEKYKKIMEILNSNENQGNYELKEIFSEMMDL